ncbi:agmatinase [Thermaurantimonas aggregans]|uniref:Agmatinase n=1 Tax=Thermaurantimonas aggregans TaxID=2173829 RepID=A0A401XKZ0_9FLAO|nr:agmatinase family protein [Thermaurantimonas aggregans]MCX8148237.1 agmatinase family protein [Thermaurantimonas aggregans]GCD77663.1 agmatinase [Thermaurantimonas aggregans]
MIDFDPNGPALHDGIFGLPFNEQNAELIILPVPWQVTVSYGEGTADAPAAIKEASKQVDLYHPLNPGAWRKGIYMPEPSRELYEKSSFWREKVADYLDNIATEKPEDSFFKAVDSACEELNKWVHDQATKFLKKEKKLILLGGDHSTPLGYIQALTEKHESFGVLQIDAHMDFRKAYEGFTYSHASISYNFMQLSGVSKVVQVGIRDYCDEELEFAKSLGNKAEIFFSYDIQKRKYRGESWDAICQSIVESLPEKIYISFDIDGLDPKLCPNTGTPVPGGLEFEEVQYLLEKIKNSGKNIIGADLNEVGVYATSDWNQNVGARVLYMLCNIIL